MVMAGVSEKKDSQERGHVEVMPRDSHAGQDNEKGGKETRACAYVRACIDGEQLSVFSPPIQLKKKMKTWCGKRTRGMHVHTQLRQRNN